MVGPTIRLAAHPFCGIQVVLLLLTFDKSALVVGEDFPREIPNKNSTAITTCDSQVSSATMVNAHPLLRPLASAIHPIFGSPIFTGLTTFFVGGFFTFTYNSAQRELKSLGVQLCALQTTKTRRSATDDVC